MSIPVFVEFIGTVAGLKGAIDEADAEMTKLSRRGATNMQKFSALSKAAVLGVGAAAVGIGAMAVTAASKFQQGMEMIHTQAGVAQDQVDKLSKAVLNLAPSVGTSPDELATALYHVESTLSSSLDPATRYQLAMQQVKIAAEGAKVGNANLEDVTNALNATMASGMVPVGDMSKAMGALNAVVGAGDMHMQDLAEALGTGVLAVVKGFGVSLQDVGAALATFGDNNIRGADAATGLRMAVQALAKPSATGGKALAELGLTATQLGKDMQTGGLNKALTDLHDRLVATGNDGDKSGEILTQAFGKKAGVGLQVLESQFSRFQQKEKEVADGASGFDSAWQATTKNFAFQFDQAKTVVEALGIKLGTILIPYVENTAQAVEHAVVWLQKHKAVAEALGVAIGTVLAAALVVATAAMIAFTVSLVTNPIFLIVAAIALLGVGIFELVKHWKQVWADIEKWALDAWQFLDGKVLQPIADFFVTVWRGFLDTAQRVWASVWGKIGGTVKAAWSFIWNVVLFPMRAAFIVLEATLKELATVASTVWGGIRAAISTVWDWLYPNVLQPLWDFFENTISGSLNDLETIFSTVWNGIESVIETVWDVIKPILDTMKRAIDDTVGAVGKVANVAGKVAGVASHAGGSVLHGLSHALGVGADGAIVTQPTFSLIGEAGPEAVIPLNQMSGARALPGGTSGNVTAQPVNVQMNGQTLISFLLQYQRSGGVVATDRNGRALAGA